MKNKKTTTTKKDKELYLIKIKELETEIIFLKIENKNLVNKVKTLVNNCAVSSQYLAIEEQLKMSLRNLTTIIYSNQRLERQIRDMKEQISLFNKRPVVKFLKLKIKI